jgi:tetratricopeptide (TPR) repeat protein
LLDLAHEEDDPDTRTRLAREALRIWPDCADAYNLLAEHARSNDDALALYEQALAAAERSLGREAFTEHQGHFWSVLETRPYMRARFGLARTLAAMNRCEEAAEHYRELLRLNPNDPQGVRWLLADTLLELERHDELRQLLDQYDEPSPNMAYPRALLAFRVEGDSAQARKALKQAVRSNQHVPEYLVGNRMLPGDIPPYVAPGSEAEAISYVVSALSGWRNTPGAISWVRQTLGLGLPEPPKRPKPNWKTLRHALLRLPQEPGEVWEVDAGPIASDNGGGRRKPAGWLVVVANVTDHNLLVLDGRTERPSATAVWQEVVGAMRKASEDPHRPERIHVRRKEYWTQWKTKLHELGIECRLYDRLEEVGPLLERGPSQAGLPHPHAAGEVEPIHLSQLGQLPQDPLETWQADVRRLPVWLDGDEKPQRPWAALVLDVAEGTVLGHDLAVEESPDAMLWRTLAAAMASPTLGEARRPGAVMVASEERAAALRPQLDAIQVETAVGRPQAADATFAALARHLTPGAQETALVDVPGMPFGQVAAYFHAAAEFYRRAPWRRIPGDTVIKIETDKPGRSPWYAVIMGQSGVTIGLAVYDDLESLRILFRQDGDEEAGVRAISVLSITYGEEFEMAVGDLDAIERYGWPIAAPEAYPHAMRMNPGFAFRPPLAWELEFLEACLRALPDFVDRKAEPTTMTVPVAGGSVAMALSPVAMTDQGRPERRRRFGQ